MASRRRPAGPSRTNAPTTRTTVTATRQVLATSLNRTAAQPADGVIVRLAISSPFENKKSTPVATRMDGAAREAPYTRSSHPMPSTRTVAPTVPVWTTSPRPIARTKLAGPRTATPGTRTATQRKPRVASPRSVSHRAGAERPAGRSRPRSSSNPNRRAAGERSRSRLPRATTRARRRRASEAMAVGASGVAARLISGRGGRAHAGARSGSPTVVWVGRTDLASSWAQACQSEEPRDGPTRVRTRRGDARYLPRRQTRASGSLPASRSGTPGPG